VITATYSEIPMSILTEPSPSNFLGSTTTQTVTSTSVPAIENTTSARVSSSRWCRKTVPRQVLRLVPLQLYAPVALLA
jgi:hypothetical protein